MTTSWKLIDTLERRIALGHPGIVNARARLANLTANGDVSTRGIYDEPKFDGRAMTPTQWIAYCRELRSKDALKPVQTVVVHHSVTSEYTTITIEQVMRNWWSYYRQTKGWSGAPHGAVFSRGIGLLNIMTADGIHCAGNNVNSRGFEIMGNFTSVLPAGALLDNAVLVFAGCLYAGKMGMDALKMHREYGGTACPGNKLAANWTWFKGLVEVKWKWFYESENPPPPPPPPAPTLEERIAACETKLVLHANAIARLDAGLEQEVTDRKKDVADINQDLMSHGAILESHEQRITTMEATLAQAAKQYADLAGRVAALEAMNGDGK